MSLDLSIVIPAYNEESRLGGTIEKALSYFRSKGLSFEIIVVDDGSTDKTADLVWNLKKTNKEITLLSYPKNEGKGYAVKFGVMNVKGRRFLIMDSDCSTPLEEFEKLNKELDSGSDLAIGSRAIFDQNQVKTVWYRKLIGRVFNFLVNIILVPKIKDTQCGFKLFNSSDGVAFFKLQTINGFAFDCEILHFYQKANKKISEVPVNWTNVSGSKVNLLVHPVEMLKDLIIVRILSFF